MFVHTARDPCALVPALTRTIRTIAPDQAVERASTLEDVRAERLSPDRINALVFSGLAGIALLIAVVGIAGVLAFSVSARTREFGMRLAVGCSPRARLRHVLSEGTAIAVIGIGAAGGLVLSRVAAAFFAGVERPGLLGSSRPPRCCWRLLSSRHGCPPRAHRGSTSSRRCAPTSGDLPIAATGNSVTIVTVSWPTSF